MTNYVFIETRDPFDSRDIRFVVDTAAALKNRNNGVTVFLIQNGVFACRKNAAGSQLSQLAEAGITLLADDFSLRERGIEPMEMATEIKPADIDALVDLLAREDTKAIWH